jgi:hypothetical protein
VGKITATPRFCSGRYLVLGVQKRLATCLIPDLIDRDRSVVLVMPGKGPASTSFDRRATSQAPRDTNQLARFIIDLVPDERTEGDIMSYNFCGILENLPCAIP